MSEWNKNKACLVAYLDLATSLNGINIIDVRNSMPSIGKHKNITLEKRILPALDWFGTFSLYTTQHKMHKSNSKEDDHINKRNQAPINYQNI
ncbi:hypothetical protein ACJX0J_041076, partial [Zea mays]